MSGAVCAVALPLMSRLNRRAGQMQVAVNRMGEANRRPVEAARRKMRKHGSGFFLARAAKVCF